MVSAPHELDFEKYESDSDLTSRIDRMTREFRQSLANFEAELSTYQEDQETATTRGRKDTAPRRKDTALKMYEAKTGTNLFANQAKADDISDDIHQQFLKSQKETIEDAFGVSLKKVNGNVSIDLNECLVKQGNTGKVIFPYDPQFDDELLLRVGDVVRIASVRDDGWYFGSIGGRRGLFPGNFVKVGEGFTSIYKQ